MSLWRSRRLRLGLLALAAAAGALLLAAALLQVLDRPGTRWRWDWSRTGSGGLSERTAAALASLPEGSALTAFLLEEEPAWTWNGAAVYPRAFARLRTLLEDARIQARGRLEVRILDRGSSLVDLEEARTRLQREPGETLVLATPRQRQVLRFEDLFQVQPPDLQRGRPARLRQERVDAALGDAALRLARERLPRVAVVTGLGELGPEPKETLRPLRSLLAAEGMEPVLVASPEEAGDADLLVVPRQDRPLGPGAASALEDWLAVGRPLLLALDAFAPDAVAAAWNRLLEEPGVHYGSGLVCQPFRGRTGLNACSVLEIGPEGLAVSHAVTRRMAEARRGLVLRGARPLLLDAGSNDFLREALVRTGARAWVEILPGPDFQPGPREPQDVQVLALAAEPLLPGQGSRILALGSSSPLLGDLALDRDLVAAGLRWLLEEEPEGGGLVAVESLPFRLPPERQARLANLCILVLPGATLLLGLLVFLRRRR